MIALKGCSLAGARWLVRGRRPGPRCCPARGQYRRHHRGGPGHGRPLVGAGTKRCAMGGRSWAALQETCYYPKVWARREGPARFTLPLGAPATPLPEAKDFGAKWIFNGKLDSPEDHSGVDCALGPGTPVFALADGTVVVAEDLFFGQGGVHRPRQRAHRHVLPPLRDLGPGRARRQEGETLGLTGSTGRVSGPHLHLGVRWHDARIDPQLLLDDPAKIPAFGK